MNSKSVLASAIMFIIGSFLLWLTSFLTIYNIQSIISGIFIIAEILLLYNISMSKAFKYNDTKKKALLIWMFLIFAFSLPMKFDTQELVMYFCVLLPSFVIPLYALFKPNLSVYRSLFRISFYFSIIYIVIYLIFFDFFYTNPSAYTFTTFAYLFAAPSSIILLTAKYHSNKAIMIALLANCLTIIMAMLLARRSTVVYFSSVLSLSLIGMLFFRVRAKIGTLTKIFIAVFIVITPCILYLYIQNNSQSFEYFFDRVDTGFSSRETIIDDMVTDFNQTPFDWVIGRGLFGGYQSSFYDVNGGEERQSMENGYLYFILKGGAIYLLLILAIVISAIYKGIFKSNNLLSKAFGLTAFIYLIDMIGFGLIAPNMKFIILFLAIGGANSYWLRNLSDEEIIKKIRV